jgi:hypothetical protein
MDCFAVLLLGIGCFFALLIGAMALGFLGLGAMLWGLVILPQRPIEGLLWFLLGTVALWVFNGVSHRRT